MCILINTLQVECHPYLNQKQLKQFCEAKGVLIAAHTPLGAPDRLFVSKDDPILLKDPIISELAQKYNRSPAQILIKYQVSQAPITEGFGNFAFLDRINFAPS